MAVVVAADQITKVWAVESLTNQPSMRVLGDFLRFTLVYNQGGAMGTQLGSSTYYLVMALLVLPFLLLFIYRNRHHRVVTLPLSFIAGGALGNLIDRINLGQVVDFIDVDFWDIDIMGYRLERFWIFNIADAAISCAIVFMIIYVFFFQKHDQHGDDLDAAVPPETVEP